METNSGNVEEIKAVGAKSLYTLRRHVGEWRVLKLGIL